MKPLKDGSQASRILAALVAGETLTPLTALRKFSCLSLSQRCTQLRARGHDVRSTMVKIGRKTVASYALCRKPQ